MLVMIIPVRLFQVPNAGSTRIGLKIDCKDQTSPVVWAEFGLSNAG